MNNIPALLFSILIIGALAATPARADFASDTLLVQQGQMSVIEAVQTAVARGESINSIVTTAVNVGFDLVFLVRGLLESGVDPNTIQAALLNIGLRLTTVNVILAVAMSEFTATTMTANGPIEGIPGSGPISGGAPFRIILIGGVSPF